MTAQSKITIIGASAAGLAAAKMLRDHGLKSDLLEAAPQIATRWRSHYERLHLHTPKSRSALPGLRFPASTPRYPSRQQVVDYLEDYARAFDLRPQFDCPVTRVAPGPEGWRIDTAHGPRDSQIVILATGYNNRPFRPDPPGIESFPGPVLHAASYKSGRDFAGQRVLVVGFGNSACEIAIDLHEQGARPALSVRGPVNVLPRDLFGLPILALGEVFRHIPRLADRLNAPLMRWRLGDLRQLGLEPLPYGPMQQIARGQVPLLDIGTLALMRAGAIGRYGAIAGIEGARIRFADGRADEFDALVFATGYRKGLSNLLDLPAPDLAVLRDDLTRPWARRHAAGAGGLYVIGGYLSPRGMLYEIARESRAIAAHIAEKIA